MSTRHGLGPELGRKPVTYTCLCGFGSIDYAEVGRHVTEENARAHEPRRLTTIAAAVGSPTSGIEVASTLYGDENDAVEIRMIVRESDGSYHHHRVIVHRSSLPFLIDELEAHRLDKDLDPCAACAAQAFAARLAAAATRIAHTCPEPAQSQRRKL